MPPFRIRGSHPLRPAVPSGSPIRSLSRRPVSSPVRKVPQPHTCNPCQVSHTHGLASSGFARHYSRNHCCFLFLWVLRCFTSPRSLTPPYIFRRESPGTHAPWRGFPIRTSSDHSSFINSPRLIADYYVLLRLQMPRHPPFALSNLKSHKYQRKTQTHHPHPKKGTEQSICVRPAEHNPKGIMLC